jgi:hypothetical protein
MVAPPSTRATAPSSTLVLPIAPFLPASVANRGALSVLGYATEPGSGGGLVATVYFMAPPAPCVPAPTVRGTGADHVTVDVDCTASSTKLFTGTPDGDVPVPQLG